MPALTPRRKRLAVRERQKEIRSKQSKITQFFDASSTAVPGIEQQQQDTEDRPNARRRLFNDEQQACEQSAPTTSSGVRAKPSESVLLGLYDVQYGIETSWSKEALERIPHKIILSGCANFREDLSEILRQMREIDEMATMNSEQGILNDSTCWGNTHREGHTDQMELEDESTIGFILPTENIIGDDEMQQSPEDSLNFDDEPSFEPTNWRSQHDQFSPGHFAANNDLADFIIPEMDYRATPIRLGHDNDAEQLTPIQHSESLSAKRNWGGRRNNSGRKATGRVLYSATTPRITNPRQSSRVKQKVDAIEKEMDAVVEAYYKQPWPSDKIRRWHQCQSWGAHQQQEALVYTATAKYVRVHSANVYFDENQTKLKKAPSSKCHRIRDNEDFFLGCAAISTLHQVDYFDSGLLGSAKCRFCGALLLKNEDRKDRVTTCCANGALHTQEMQHEFNELQNPPQAFLDELVGAPDERIREEFLKNTMTLNNSFAFASIGVGRAPDDQLGIRKDTCKINGDFSFLYYDLEPPDGCMPKFAQTYTLDPDEAFLQRDANIRDMERKRISPQILRSLDNILRDSPLGRTFSSIWDRVHEIERQTGNVPRYRIILLSAQQVRDEDMMNNANFTVIERADSPTANQVAVVWVSDDGSPPEIPGFWICDHRGRQRPLPNTSPHLVPSCFPLLRPRGTPGWRPFIKKKKNEQSRATQTEVIEEDDNVGAVFDNTMEDLAINDDAGVENLSVAVDDTMEVEEIEDDQQEDGASTSAMPDVETSYDDTGQFIAMRRGPRENISQRQYVCYQMQLRGEIGRDNFHWLWFSRKLDEYYLISELNRIERSELEFVKKQQEKKNLRKILAKEYVANIEKNLQRKYNGKLGQIFLLPKTFPGSNKYFSSRYGDLMTMVQNFGNPTWFLTFTGNPNWPEIQTMLGRGQEWVHRPDLVCRVFMSKATEFLKDVTERHVLGKVKGWCYSVEHQKRGMPHIHLLLFMDECSIPKMPKHIDAYVSARIPPLPPMDDTSPEANQARRLHYTVITHHLHTCSEAHCLDEHGRCAKYFPKPYSDETIISEARYTEYVRLNPFHREDDPTDSMLGPSTDIEQHLGIQYERRRPPPRKAKDWTKEGLVYMHKRRGKPVQMLDDSHVVPYNPFLLLKYGCHINVEYVFGQRACKYIFKYILKGFEKGYVRVEKARQDVGAQEDNVYNYDESNALFKVRYMTAMEAYLRLVSFPIVKMSHQVITLPLHEENGQTIIFDEEHEEEIEDRIKCDTQLTGFFKLCQVDNFAKTLTYTQLPYYYWWNKKLRMWKKRVHDRDANIDTTDLFVRMYTANPKRHELLAIRTLLLHVTGPTSFVDLRTVFDSETGEQYKCTTFTEAAQRRGLLASDAMHVGAMEDACKEMGNLNRRHGDRRLQRYFAMLLNYAAPSDPQALFDKFLDQMFPQPSVNISRDRNQAPITEQFRRNEVLKNLEYFLRCMGSSCILVGLAVAPVGYDHEAQEAEIEGAFLEEDFYGIDGRDAAGRRLRPEQIAKNQIAKLNDEQRAIFDEISKAVRGATNQKCFDIQGYGGCGKTFLFETIIKWMFAGQPYVGAIPTNFYTIEDTTLKRGSVLATASTGIAATLLIGGTTAHSMFYIPNDVNATTTPKVNNESVGAQRFRDADLIILDEQSMLHNHVLLYIDRLLKEVCASNEPFGGKVFVTAGDWHQLAPVVPKGTRIEQVRASIKACPLFKNNFKTLRLQTNMRTNPGEISFAKWLLMIGEGRDEHGNKTAKVEIPEENTTNSLDELIEYCFPKKVLDAPLDHIEELCNASILCPWNKQAAEINDRVLKEMAGQEYICESLDAPLLDGSCRDNSTFCADYNIELINSLTYTGLPPHVLRLKVGAPVMLIRNLDLRQGLCNGTRLQVIRVTQHNVICRIATGPRKGQDVVLPQVKFTHGKEHGNSDVHFTRIQFPLRLCFAMTINKAQGQTLKKMGLALQEKEVFGHGQLYTALSRVTCKDGFRVFSHSKVLGQALNVKNIVYYELLED